MNGESAERARAERSRALAAAAAVPRSSVPSVVPYLLLRAAGSAGPFGNRIANVI